MKAPKFLHVLPAKEEGRSWNVLIFSLQLLLFAPAVLWIRYARLPAPGWSIAVLAIAAALISIHDKVTGPQKAIWLLLTAFFLVDELRAIAKDRWASAEQQRLSRQEEQKKFLNLLRQEKQDKFSVITNQENAFSTLAKQQQESFRTTLIEFLKTEVVDRAGFQSVLSKQQKLYQHEEELAASQSGVLIPGSSSTPMNNCAMPSGESVLLIL